MLTEDSGRVLTQGEPFVIVDVKKEKLVVKEGELFLYSDIEGNVSREDTSGLGLYFQDTRFLSTFDMTLFGTNPVLLSSTADRGFMSQIELTNADFMCADGTVVPQETINIRRIRVVNGKLYELIRIKNYNHFPVDISLEFDFDSDFADMFEVRGTKRTKYGTRLAPKITEDSHPAGLSRPGRHPAKDRYPAGDAADRDRGHDGHLPLPAQAAESAGWSNTASSRSCRPRRPPAATDFNKAIGDVRKSYESWFKSSSQIETDNELFTAVLQKQPA